MIKVVVPIMQAKRKTPKRTENTTEPSPPFLSGFNKGVKRPPKLEASSPKIETVSSEAPPPSDGFKDDFRLLSRLGVPSGET